MNFKKVAVILAGGVGSRFNSNIPKQFLMLNDKRVIDYSIDIFSQIVDEIILVLDKSYFADFNGFEKVENGTERYYSLDNAMKYLSKKFDENTIVITHDSARPIIDKCEILEMINGVSKKPSHIHTFVKPVTSSYFFDDKIIDRNKLKEIVTPQACTLNTYFSKNILNDSCTDLCSYGELNNIKSIAIETKVNNIKITNPQDLNIVKNILGENNG